MKSHNIIFLGFISILLVLFIPLIIQMESIEDLEYYEIKEVEEVKVTLDLPEEYPLATKSDTLIAIKRGNTLFIQFNNK